MTAIHDADTHHESVDVTRPSRRPHVLMLVANPTTSSTTGWPVGFWAAELFHPLYRITVASPDGGRVELDALSDPRDESRWSADDLISMGALNTPEIARLLEQTPKLADLDFDEYDALVVCGGQAPMVQFRDNVDLQRAIAAFYEAEKPTAALCHGVCSLLDVELSDGTSLIEGKTITGFANVEEDFTDAAAGQRVQPFRIENEARRRGANYVQAGLFKAFAIRDNQLITGQQQYSGTKVAQLVIESIGV
jgi:putative intracellular protease/amidase